MKYKTPSAAKDKAETALQLNSLGVLINYR